MRRSRARLECCCALAWSLSVTLPGTAVGQGPPEFATVDLKATIVGTRVAADSVVLRIDQDTTGPLRLVLRGPSRRGLPQLRAGRASERLGLDLAVENRSSTTFRIPLWLYVDHQPVAVQRGRAVPRGDSWDYIQVQSYQRTDMGGYAMQERADVGWPITADGNNNYVRLHRIEAPGHSLDSLRAGGRSPDVPLGLAVLPGVHAFRVELTLRALRTAPTVPTAAPHGIPVERLGAEHWTRSDRVPGPFVKGLLAIRFRPTTSAGLRQLLVERVGGRVVGGRGESTSAAAERDYLVEIADTATGEQTLAALGLLRQWGEPHLLRAGVVLAESPMPPGTRSSGPAVIPTITEEDLEIRRAPYLQIRLAEDASAAEQQAAFALVGATLVARVQRSGELIAHIAGSSDQAYEQAEARLAALPIVRHVFAWELSLDSMTACAGSCGPPPRDAGRAPEDSLVRVFVASLQLPTVHAIQDVAWLPEVDFLAFRVVYGNAFDVYPEALGLRHRGRIGLLRNDTTGAGARFPYSSHDTVLVSAALLDTLERGFDSFYGYDYLEAVIRSPLVTPALLARIVRRCCGPGGLLCPHGCGGRAPRTRRRSAHGIELYATQIDAIDGKVSSAAAGPSQPRSDTPWRPGGSTSCIVRARAREH